MAGSKALRPGRGRRIIFVNRFFYPDESATAQILTDLAAHLASRPAETGAGEEVHIITSRLSYADPSVRHAAEETWSGVTIHRVATTGFGRGKLVGRAVDYLSFYASSFFKGLGLARRGDVVVAKTDPPLLGVTMGLAGRLKGARRVNWLQDVFPEVAAASDIRVPLAGVLKALRNRSLVKADLNVAIGSRMRDLVVAETGGRADAAIIHNYVDDALVPDPEGAAELRAEWGYGRDDFIIGYSGNLGRAHDIETVLAAAERLKTDPSIHFLFVGGGHLRADVEARASALSLTNVATRAYVPRALLAQSLSLPDVHWVTLIPAMEGLIVPSKLYGIAAAGRPALVVGDPAGELAQMVEAHRFGLNIVPGDGAGFAAAVQALKADRARIDAMGQAARRFAETEGARRRAFALWEAVLDRLA
ncbi:MAG: glycosyltransferase family 4 protein [Pseudomonadota bacterium]